TVIQLDGTIARATKCSGGDSGARDRRICDVGEWHAHLQRSERRPTRGEHRHSQFFELQCGGVSGAVYRYFCGPLSTSGAASHCLPMSTSAGDTDYMRRALLLARRAADEGEVPIG